MLNTKNNERRKVKNLYIIITNSLQNDFLEERFIEEIKNDNSEPDLKLGYETCAKKWLNYFKDKKKNLEENSVEKFLQWIRENPVSEGVDYSYHKFLEKYGHRVHVDIQQSDRLWRNYRLKNFINDLMDKAAKTNEEKGEDVYQFIHLRDWHDPSDTGQLEETFNFGKHCIKGSHGAHFIKPLAENINKYQTFNQVINSNSLSSFSDTNLDKVLTTIMGNYDIWYEKAKIGVFGVVTNVKLKLLTFELKVVHNFKKVYLCEDLCAGFNQAGHQDGLDYMKFVLGVKLKDEEKFRNKFNFNVKTNY